MKDEIRDNILKIFDAQSGYARTKDITDAGIHNIYLNELEQEGTIQKIKHGLYSLTSQDITSSYYEAILAVNNGVICMGSALSFYELTTWNPTDIHIAIKRGRRIKLPDYPPIQIYNFSHSYFEIGQTEAVIDSGETIPIYDMEKTICDAVRLRNQIGIDIMKEALNEYVRNKNRNLNKLNDYATRLKISTVLNQYLEVLI